MAVRSPAPVSVATLTLAVATLAVAAATLAACSSSSNVPHGPDGGTARDAADASEAADAGASEAPLSSMAFPHQMIRDVDLLFVVDDAPGMAALQQTVRAALPAFTDSLKDLPAGYPSLHVAVVSADLGAGADPMPADCNAGGDRGVFWTVPRGPCAATGLPDGQAYFSIESGGGQTNFAPALGLSDALACVWPRVDAGCPFPHPFAAALRALGADGAPAPPENAGFLRAGAFLAIVLVTNQDDCSAPPDTQIFDPSSMFAADAFGPLTSFRCARFGLTCGGAPVPDNVAGALTGCASAEDGILLRVSDAVAALKSLKSDPNMILVASISGPPQPFAVELDPPGLTNDPSPWPSLAPSCQTANGVISARPGVRVEQWVYAFGHNGVLASACDDPPTSLREIATTIAGVLGPPCLTAAIAQTTGPRGVRPDCTIVDYSPALPDAGAAAGGGAGKPIPSCVDTGDVAPCWTLADDIACPGGKLLGFMAPAGDPAIGADSSVQCVVCEDPADPRCH
jgi:hypothetical protein